MKVYKLTSWIDPEYGPTYAEKEEFFLVKNKKAVLEELSNRGILLDEWGENRHYYSMDREEKVYKLEKIKVTKIKPRKNDANNSWY